MKEEILNRNSNKSELVSVYSWFVCGLYWYPWLQKN